jgi:hypothetical protein
MADTNLIAPLQSFTGNLAPNASFVGSFENVENYTSITVTAIASIPPAPTNAIQFEWSSDGINIDSITVFGSDASTQQTAHGTVRAAFFRTRYTAGSSGLTGARVQTLFRTGPHNASVSRIGLVTGAPDALNTNAVLLAKSVVTGSFLSVLATADPFLIVTPPTSSVVFRIVTTANLSSVAVDVAGLGAPNRRSMTIFNNTIRGNLYIRLATTAVTLINYDFKIPPQHTWTMPQGWPVYRGAGQTVQGIWDVADGECHVMEVA